MVELATRTGTAGISRAGRFRTLQMVELAERLRHDECVVRGKGWWVFGLLRLTSAYFWLTSAYFGLLRL